MLSLLLVASLVLPSVLGHCCFPEKMSAVIYTSGTLDFQTALVDFTQKKILSKPSSGDTVSTLIDIKEGKTYTRFRDGSCTVGAMPLPEFEEHCIPETAQHVATVTLAGKLVEGYRITAGKDAHTTIVVTEKDCLPVVMVSKFLDTVQTNFYTNVTSAVSDVSELSQDVSDCKGEEV